MRTRQRQAEILLFLYVGAGMACLLPEELDFGRYTLEARQAIAYSLRSARRSGATVISLREIEEGLGSPAVYASKYRKIASLPDAAAVTSSPEGTASAAEDSRVVPFDEDVRAALRSALQATTEDGRKRITSADILLATLRQTRTSSPHTDTVLAEIRAGMAKDRRDGVLPLE